MFNIGDDGVGGATVWVCVWLDRLAEGRLVVEGDSGIELTSGMIVSDQMSQNGVDFVATLGVAVSKHAKGSRCGSRERTLYEQDRVHRSINMRDGQPKKCDCFDGCLS
jgi:hypothetical protein